MLELTRFVPSCTLASVKQHVAVALLLLSACAKGAEPTPVTPPPTASAAEAPIATTPASTLPVASTAPSAAPVATTDPTAKILSKDVLAKVCGATCGGPNASIRIYRDTAGKVTRLFRIYGSCSHSPGIYFTPEGKEGDSIPEKPITPGSAEAKKLEAIHDANTKGLTHTDSVSCRDGSRSAP